ncbi:hypothetical protein JMA_35790 [Jeotgalibacillus malaysiensis]|uniref:YcxB-like protein domain-containing protein n=1 Tax=Jeotgalibacillus malaysiensis TaxID=1508404 RepID=A0A0B5AS49_9BACL|nr:hypothetical protein [Jeotgalibacillus malaysiensis]AJD92896.1 hypothetical protein JMA_35790 [Jeotgalibacillus malaysiensis]
MNNNIATLEFQTTKKDYIELVKYMPISRLLYWIQLGVVFLISVAYYIYLRISNEISIESSAALTAFHVIEILASVLFLIIIGTASHFAMIANFKNSGKKLFYKFSHGNNSMQQVILDKKSNELLIGKVQQQIPLDHHLTIVSTKQNYLFYYTKEKKPDKFFIPKNGDKDFEQDLQEVMNYILKNKNIRYHSKNH